MPAAFDQLDIGISRLTDITGLMRIIAVPQRGEGIVTSFWLPSSKTRTIFISLGCAMYLNLPFSMKKDSRFRRDEPAGSGYCLNASRIWRPVS